MDKSKKQPLTTDQQPVASAPGIQTADSYRAIFDAANDAIFVHDLQTGAILDVNHRITEMYGYTIEEARQLDVEVLSAGTPPYTQQAALHWLKKTVDGEPQLFEWLAKDKAGRLFWVEVNIKRATIGGAERLIAIVRDITRRKRVEGDLRRSEGELRALAGRLISAKEEENRRLARELHDVFSQRLAVLAMDVSAIEKEQSSSSNPLRKSLQRIGSEIERLATDVHLLSRELHPSIIDHLGLIAALRAECATFSIQHGISAEFFTEVPDSFPADISLSLYRITQESLWNVAKHAQAQNVRLAIAEGDGQVILIVEDDGIGFDLNRVKGKGSLGLVSIEERARLLGGSFVIQSQPGKGTKVEVRIPLPHRGV